MEGRKDGASISHRDQEVGLRDSGPEGQVFRDRKGDGMGGGACAQLKSVGGRGTSRPLLPS